MNATIYAVSTVDSLLMSLPMPPNGCASWNYGFALFKGQLFAHAWTTNSRGQILSCIVRLGSAVNGLRKKGVLQSWKGEPEARKKAMRALPEGVWHQDTNAGFAPVKWSEQFTSKEAML